MTSPDRPDWVATVAQAETETTVVAIPAGTATPWTSGTFDTSRAQVLRIFLATDNTLQNSVAAVNVTWDPGQVGSTLEQVSFFDSASATPGGGGVYVEMPVRAASCSVLVSPANPGTITSGRIVTSTRQPFRRTYQSNRAGGGKVLARADVKALAAGASDTYWVSPVAQALALSIQGSANGLVASVFAGSAVTGGLAPLRMVDLAVPLTVTVFPEITVPDMGVQLVVSNPTAVAATYGMRLWDTSR